jgi:hypothetical protein
MNLLKKLKLVLLASGVILSPKGGYAADHERDDAHKMLTRPGPSHQVGFNSMLPALDENKHPSSSSQSINEIDAKLYQDLIFAILGEKPARTSLDDIKKMQSICAKKYTPGDYDTRIMAVRSVLNMFIPPFEFSNRSEQQSILQKIALDIFDLPLVELNARSKAIENMANELYTFRKIHHGMRIYTTKGLENFKESRESLSIIYNLLKLNSHQIDNRTKMIKTNIDDLLPTGGFRIGVIGHLMNLQTEEIGKRATLLKGFFDTAKGWKDRVLELSAPLSSAELVSRIDNTIVSIEQFSPRGAEGLSDRALAALASVSLKFEPEEFSSCLNSLKLNSTLMQWMNSDPNGVSSQIVSLSFDEISKRAAVIKQYEALLTPLATQYSKRQLGVVSDFLNQNVDEIYSLVKAHFYENYFQDTFLKDMGNKFRALNGSQLTDSEIAKLLFARDHSPYKDYSPVAIRAKLSKFGSVYLGLYNPPSLPEPVFAAGPSSSSGPLASSQVSIEDSSIPFNSSFKGASPSGAVPQGYTFVADPAQKAKKYGPTSVTQIEAGHVAVKGDGYVFYQQLTASAMKALDGQSFEFMVDVKSDTPGVYIQYWGYPDHEKLMSAFHKGLGAWETLRINFTVDGNDSQFFLYPVIMPAVSEGLTAPVVEVKNLRLLRRS